MKIKIISLFLIVGVLVIIVLGIYMIHMYPTKIATKRKHPQTKAIEVTSIMGLIFFPLWVFALIWAYSNAVLGVLYNGGDTSEDIVAANESVGSKSEDEQSNQDNTKE